MKQIINGKLYNTETAREVAYHSNGRSTRDFSYCEETLYRKRTGEYFLLGSGGPMSKYALRIDSNCCGGDTRIVPISLRDARKWGEENMDADDYIAEFGEVAE